MGWGGGYVNPCRDLIGDGKDAAVTYEPIGCAHVFDGDGEVSGGWGFRAGHNPPPAPSPTLD